MIGRQRQQLHDIGRAAAPPSVGGDSLIVDRNRESTQKLDREQVHSGIVERDSGPAQWATRNGSGTVATVASARKEVSNGDALHGCT